MYQKFYQIDKEAVEVIRNAGGGILRIADNGAPTGYSNMVSFPLGTRVKTEVGGPFGPTVVTLPNRMVLAADCQTKVLRISYRKLEQ